MPKGHNQEHNNEKNAQSKKNTPGQTGHLKNSAREKVSSKKTGRNEKEDQSGGKKGQNAI